MIGNKALSWSADLNAEIAECKNLLKECKKFNIQEVNRHEEKLKLGEEIWSILAPQEEKDAFYEFDAVKKEEKIINELRPKIKRLNEEFKKRSISQEYCQVLVNLSEPDTSKLQALLNYAESNQIGNKRAAYFAAYACKELLNFGQKLKLLDKAILFEGQEKVVLRRADVRKAYVGDQREERLNQAIINSRERYYLEAKSYYEQSLQGETKGYAKAELKELEKWHAEWSNSSNAVVRPTIQPGGESASGSLGTDSLLRRKFIIGCVAVAVVILGLNVVGQYLENYRSKDEAEKFISTTYADGSVSMAKYTVEDGVIVGISDIVGKKLTIPADVDGQKITEIKIYLDSDEIEAISIPEGVVSIGNSFCSMEGLKEIILPSTLKKIDNYSFEGSDNLERIVFAENSQLEYIEDGIFRNTIWYSRQIMEHGYVLAGNLLLEKDALAEEIYIPEGTTAINAGAFYGDKSVTNITIPANVKKIGRSAFEGSGLTNIVFEGNIDLIGERAFAELSDLKNVTFMGHVKEFGVEAFYACHSLSDFKLPEGVVKIGKAAFMYCSNLNNIVLPEGVKEIGNEAFAVYFLDFPIMQQLLVIPESLEIIGENAFTGHGFESIEVRGNIKEIGHDGLGEVGNISEENGMYRLDNILLAYTGDEKNVVIPDGITCIVGRSFAGKSMVSVTIPEGVTAISAGTFENCGALQRVNLPTSLEVIRADAFKVCESLPFIDIPENVTTIGSKAFGYCGRLNLIEGGDGLVDVAEDAFYDSSVPTNFQEKLNKLWGIVEEE